MHLNVGNGYDRSAVPGFVILQCWAQRYTAANSPGMTGNSYVFPWNGHNPSLHWRIPSFRGYSLLLTTFRHPQPPHERGVVFTFGEHNCRGNQNYRQVAIGTFLGDFYEKAVAQSVFKIFRKCEFPNSGKPSFYIGINIFL